LSNVFIFKCLIYTTVTTPNNNPIVPIVIETVEITTTAPDTVAAPKEIEKTMTDNVTNDEKGNFDCLVTTQ